MPFPLNPTVRTVILLPNIWRFVFLCRWRSWCLKIQKLWGFLHNDFCIVFQSLVLIIDMIVVIYLNFSSFAILHTIFINLSRDFILKIFVKFSHVKLFRWWKFAYHIAIIRAGEWWMWNILWRSSEAILWSIHIYFYFCRIWPNKPL